MDSGHNVQGYWCECLLFSLQPPSKLQWVLEKIVLLMIVYFVCSIVNSMAQSYAKRLDDDHNAKIQPRTAESKTE